MNSSIKRKTKITYYSKGLSEFSPISISQKPVGKKVSFYRCILTLPKKTKQNKQKTFLVLNVGM